MPQNEVTPKHPHYDIALSFAGEDREYVEAVAGALRAKGIRVFYDGYEEASLWGKDLYTHLSQVYENDARFTVMFISHHYAEKLWTNHERRSAQARAFAEHREYILPARFDATEVPGILRTTAYVDLRRKSPAALAELIAEKLRSVTKGTHRERHILVPQDFDTAGYVLFSTPLEDHTGLYIAVDPQQYLSFRDILDDLFINYFSAHVDPFTYGSQWIVQGEPFNKRLIVPIQWVSQPWHTINEIAPEWLSSSLVELGLTSNTHWKISVVRDTTLMLPGRTTTLGDIIRRSVGPSYVFGCDNPQLWSLITRACRVTEVAQLRS